MTDPLTRPLDNNRILRAISGPSLSVSLGSSLGAVFETPTMTELMAETGKQLNERTGFTPQQTADREAQTQQARITGASLAREITLTVPGDDRDALIQKYEDVQRNQDLFVSSQVQDSIDAGRLQSKEALTEKHKDLGLTFDREMSTGEADILAQNKRAEITRNAIIQAGPQGPVATGLKFGAGLAAMATDPLEIATMFIPIVGQAGKVAAVARFGRVGGRVAVGAIEGGVGNALTEPLFFGLSKQLQLDYTMSDALLNIGLGAAFGGGIGTVSGVLSRADVPEGIAGIADPKQTPVSERVRIDPEINREASNIALRQFVNGQKVTVAELSQRAKLKSSTTLATVLGVESQPSAKIEIPQKAPDAEISKSGFDPKIVLFHGTDQKFDQFDIEKSAGGGIWFTDKKSSIEAGEVGAAGTGRVIDARVRKGLKFAGWDEYDKFSTDELINQGFGGVRLPDGDEITYAIFDTKDIAIIEPSGKGKTLEYATTSPQTAPEIATALKNRKTNDAKFLAKNAANTIPFEDAKAARQFNETVNIDRTKPGLVQEDIDIFDGMVKQIDETEGLTVEQKQLLDDVTAMEERATAYADVSKIAATCLART